MPVRKGILTWKRKENPFDEKPIYVKPNQPNTTTSE